MLKANIEKLELARKEVEKVGEIAERAMRKLDEIIEDINRLEQEESFEEK